MEYEREKGRMFIFLNNRSLRELKENCEEVADLLGTKWEFCCDKLLYILMDLKIIKFFCKHVRFIFHKGEVSELWRKQFSCFQFEQVFRSI